MLQIVVVDSQRPQDVIAHLNQALPPSIKRFFIVPVSEPLDPVYHLINHTNNLTPTLDIRNDMYIDIYIVNALAV